MFKLSKVKKCPLCKQNKLTEDSPQIRLDTSEGVHELTICEECADFFEKSAEVLMNKGSKDDESI